MSKNSDSTASKEDVANTSIITELNDNINRFSAKDTRYLEKDYRIGIILNFFTTLCVVFQQRNKSEL